MSIDHVHVGRIDISLLALFDAVIQEGSVTRAAALVGIGQPAASHGLARLRRLFGDELFVRSGTTMVPTPRSRELAPEVRSILSAIQSAVLSTTVFDPATSSRAFRIGLSASVELALAPELLSRLAEQAPGARLELRSGSPDQLLGMVDEGALDLAIGGFDRGGFHHRRRSLADSDGYLCLFDAARTGLSGQITLDQFVGHRHVTVLSVDRASAVLEDALAREGLKRDVACKTQNVLAVPHLLQRAPLIAILCRRTALACAEQFGLATSELPFELPLNRMAMVWHSSSEREPGNVWLRQLVATCIDWSRGEASRQSSDHPAIAA